MSTLSINKNSNNSQRYSIDFDPSVWGDFFITYTHDNKNTHAWREEAKTLKETVRKVLVLDEYSMTSEQLKGKISMIDTIQRLGIAHHFIGEIQEMLERIFKYCEEENNYEQYEITTLALLFRILRQQGHNISCDIFNRFKDDDKDEIKEVITEDIEGMLSLYEATHLRVHGETILEKAHDFTKTTLENKVPYLKPSLAKHVRHTLRWPIQKSLPRLGAREFISFYEDVESRDEDLLKFAKLDFNLLQMQHIEELNAITKWWKDIDVKKNLSYARDRVTECYFWMLAVYYEPEYALARNFSTKIISIISVIDDTYDAYGTYEELELLTNAFRRWDISAMDEIPEYMKIIYQTVLQTYDEMEEELIKEGRRYALSYLKQAMQRVIEGLFEESKWLLTKKMPSMEEYKSVRLITTGYPYLAIVTVVGMGEVGTEDVLNWLSNDPPVVLAISVICRYMDDIVPHKGEVKGMVIPTAIECYMNQYNASVSEACEYLNKEVENAWKDVNYAFLDPDVPSRLALFNILGLARVIKLLYTDEDIYTCSEKMKPYVDSVLVNPIKI